MPRVVTGKVNRLLARWAGIEAGMEFPADMELADAATAVVTNPDAAKLYDLLVCEYEQRLKNPIVQYQQIRDWLRDNGADVALSSIQRDRERFRRRERVHEVVNSRIAAVFDGLKGLDADEVYTKGLDLAMRKLLEVLIEADPASLDAVSADQLIACVGAFGRLGKARSEKLVIDERLKALRAEYDGRVKAATREAPDGKLDEKTLAGIARDVFGA